MPDSPMIIQTPRFWPCAVLAVCFALSASLPAQSTKATISQSPSPQANQSALAQVQILTNRIALLEQKLAAYDKRLTIDEASSTFNPQSAVAPAGGEDPVTPAAPGGGLSKSDQARLANLEQQVSQLQQQQQSSQNGFVSHPNRVTAPFQVVSTSGNVLMSVEDWKSGSAGGMKVFAPNGSYVQAGPGVKGWSALRVYSGPGSLQAMIGLENATISGMSLMTSGGKDTTHISDVAGNGEVDISNSADMIVAYIGASQTNGTGHADFLDTTGTTLAEIGVDGNHGDVVLDNKAGYRVPVWEFAFVAPIF